MHPMLGDASSTNNCSQPSQIRFGSCTGVLWISTRKWMPFAKALSTRRSEPQGWGCLDWQCKGSIHNHIQAREQGRFNTMTHTLAQLGGRYRSTWACHCREPWQQNSTALSEGTQGPKTVLKVAYYYFWCKCLAGSKQERFKNASSYWKL